MTIPTSYAEHNRLNAGSRVSVKINGNELVIKSAREKTLAELLAATPARANRVDSWEDILCGGTEI